MIRPFTLICMASAFGAGLYLYQSKHAAQVLDREITRTMKQTEATRDRTGMLKAEWAVLNEPDRLAELARAHLSLQTLKPTQFATMNDLANRLPAPVASQPEPLPAEPEPEAPATIAQAAPPPAASPAPVTAPLPAPAKVASVPDAKAKIEAKTAVRTAEKTIGEKAAGEKAAGEKTTGEKGAVEKPVIAHAEPSRAAEPIPLLTSVHARPLTPPVVSTEATAPGTVGAAVLRAMRAQGNGYAAAAPAPIRAYTAPVAVQPTYTPPAYAQPVYARPAYAPPPSVLGGQPALPPPVPFAAR